MKVWFLFIYGVCVCGYSVVKKTILYIELGNSYQIEMNEIISRLIPASNLPASINNLPFDYFGHVR